MEKKIERTSTGINGLDEIIEGGFPKGRMMMVTGATGSGKTTFGMQFLINGATMHGENGIFVTLQEELTDLVQDMGRYGWELDELCKQRKLAIVQSPIPFEVSDESIDIDALLDTIHTKANEINAQRIVFDSIVQLGLPYNDNIALRRDITRLGTLLRELGCSTILISEIGEGEQKISRYGVEEFVVQGVIILHRTNTYRALQVAKMRGTKHDTDLHRMRLTDRGVVIVPGERPY